MSERPLLSEDIREDLADCMKKSKSIDKNWLINGILHGSSLSDEMSAREHAVLQYNIHSMTYGMLVDEAVDLIEENHKGEGYTLAKDGSYPINLSELRKEREKVESKFDVEDHNGMIAAAVIAGENTPVSDTIAHFRRQEDKETGLVSNPFDTPKGASVKIGVDGVDISAKGTHLDNLREGFENIEGPLVALRSKVLRAHKDKKAESDLGSSMSLG